MLINGFAQFRKINVKLKFLSPKFPISDGVLQKKGSKTGLVDRDMNLEYCSF